MLKTKPSVTTDAGIALQLANLQGEAIEFTKIVAGCGQYTAEEQSAEALVTRSGLKEPKQTFGISSQELSANGTAIVLSCMVTNKDLQEGYTIREIGLYARKKDQPDTEQLVSISLAEIEDELPAYDGASESRILMKYQFTVSNSDTVYLSYDHDPVALVKDVDAKLNRLPELEQEIQEQVETLKKEYASASWQTLFPDMCLFGTTTFSDNNNHAEEVYTNGYRKTTDFNTDGSAIERLYDPDGNLLAAKKTVSNADGSMTSSPE